MKVNWRKNINFSKGDRVVLLLISLLLVSLYGFNFLYKPAIKYETSNTSLDTVLKELGANMSLEDNKKYQRIATYNSSKRSIYPPVEYFKFDPNTIDSIQWLKLGLRPWVIKSLLKQRRGGWKFYSCDKLKDTYNLPDSVYQKIRPYCYITPKKLKSGKSTRKNFKKNKTKTRERPIEYFEFDPNTLDSTGWIKLGLEPWTVKTLMKQRRNGWTFYNCEKLRDIYKLPDSVYQKINPYCNIASTSKQKAKKSYPQRASAKVVKLNKASTDELQSLWGIGSFHAKEILEYKNNLGGFHSVDQLAEVWWIVPEVVEKNKKRLLVTGIERQLSLNAPQDSLAKHPYIRYRLAKHISRYRQQHGKFKSVEELKNMIVVHDSTYAKLYPYLKI